MLINDAVNEMREKFGVGTAPHPYIRGIAVDHHGAADVIRVYLCRAPTAKEEPIPAEWQGYKIVTPAWDEK